MGAYNILIILAVVVCLLLIIVIMVQNPKGGGLSSSFGGGGGQMFGVQKTNDFLEKSTWYLISTVAALVILANIFAKRSSSESELINPDTVQTAPAATDSVDDQTKEVQK